jgi:hypothetical protein
MNKNCLQDKTQEKTSGQSQPLKGVSGFAYDGIAKAMP